MRRELLLPKLGLTMTEGRLVEWLVQPGENFSKGQSLFVVESEKASVEVPAAAGGRLLETVEPKDAPLPVGTVVAYWESDEEGPASERQPVPDGQDAALTEPQQAGHRPAATAAPPPPPSAPAAGSSRLVATPLARRLAVQRGIDLRQVAGSGPRGRIRVRDLEALPLEAVPDGVAGAGRIAPTPFERTAARRLVQSKQEIPHFYLSIEAELSRLLALRADLNAAGLGRKFTINHFILTAVGRALADEPRANRIWSEDGFVQFESQDVGMAVDTEAGLLVPILRDVGRQPLESVAVQADAAAQRARHGRIAPGDIGGGAITVSNAGMHGVTYMGSIIDPSQSMILGVGALRELFRPDEQGMPALHREVGLVLSVDHRVHNGVGALRFLGRIKHHLEDPLPLLLSGSLEGA